MISVILVISLVSHVDFSIVLLLLRGPLATELRKLSSGFRSLDTCVNHYEEADRHLGLLHGDLLRGLDVADSVTEGIDDLNVLDVRDSFPGVTKMFHVVPEALIMLLSDGL
jgi:hypothetical protein